jgi:hypothetical protein
MREAECCRRALASSATLIGSLRVGRHETFVGMRAVGQLGARCVCCCTRQVPVLRPGLFQFLGDCSLTPGSSGRLWSDPGNEVISPALFASAVFSQLQQATSHACL